MVHKRIEIPIVISSNKYIEKTIGEISLKSLLLRKYYQNIYILIAFMMGHMHFIFDVLDKMLIYNLSGFAVYERGMISVM